MCKNDIAVRVESKEEWNILMNIFDSCNLRWKSDKKAKEFDVWHKFKSSTCVWVNDIYRITCGDVLFVTKFTKKNIISVQDFIEGQF